MRVAVHVAVLPSMFRLSTYDALRRYGIHKEVLFLRTGKGWADWSAPPAPGALEHLVITSTQHWAQWAGQQIHENFFHAGMIVTEAANWSKRIA